MTRVCVIEDCRMPIARQGGRGWCTKHYTRWRRYGDPFATPYREPSKFFEEVLAYEGDECLMWPYSHTGGYGHIGMNGRLQRVPRLVCEARHGPPPTPKHDAAHSCGKGHLGCVTGKHLRWATRKENSDDKLLHGTHPSFRASRRSEPRHE